MQHMIHSSHKEMSSCLGCRWRRRRKIHNTLAEMPVHNKAEGRVIATIAASHPLSSESRYGDVADKDTNKKLSTLAEAEEGPRTKKKTKSGKNGFVGCWLDLVSWSDVLSYHQKKSEENY